MAVHTGNNGVVKVADADGTLTSLAAVRSFTLDITSDTIETTTMGVDARTYVKGLSSFTGSADIYWDESEYPTSDASGQLAGLNPTLEAVGHSPYAIELYLDSTSYKFSGNIIITGFSVNSSMDGMVEASISFQGSGGATYAAS
jgi:predicted secreted protein